MAMRVLERWYVRLLRVLPREFREAHGPAMVQLFAERLSEVRADGGVVAAWVHGMREAADVVKTAIHLRRRGRSSESGGSRHSLRGLSLDFRHAIRLWGRRPGLTLLVLLVIGLGIGTTSTMFTVADGVLFRPLPHRDPGRLVMVSQTLRARDDARVPVSYPNLADFRSSQSSGLEAIAAYRFPFTATVELEDEPEALQVDAVGGNLLTVLGNRAELGRGISPADDVPGVRVAVLSDGLWRSRFGGEASVLGRSIRIEGKPYEVVGVMPADFVFPSAVNVWIPLGVEPATAERDTRFLQAIGRLAPGVSLAEAQRRMSAVMDRLVAEYPAENAGTGVRIDRRRDVVIGGARPAMQVLLGAVGLLLLLVCATVANLLLARVSARSGELALRGALGAGRRRIMAQLALEHLLLAVAGGLLGLGLAWLGTKLMVDLAPASLPRHESIRLDGRGIVFAVGVTLLSAVLFGLLPAWWATSRRAGSLLGRGYRWASAPADRLLRGLVVVQLAVAMVLLIGGGLLVRSFVRLASVDPGFVPDGVFTMRVALPPDRYDSAERVRAFFARLVDRAAALPGVESAGATWAIPFGGDYASGNVTAEGEPAVPGQEPVVGLIPVAGDYFGALSMDVLAGRSFTDREYTDSSQVAVVNETAARLLWPDGVAVGRRFKRGAAAEDRPWVTVVGVVADARRSGLDAPVQPETYWPHRLQAGWARDMSLVVRTPGDPMRIAAPLRALLRELDPELAVLRPGRLGDLISARIAEPRFRTVLVAVFGAAALILALSGIYGVMAFAVSRQTHAIGVRMALGAGRTRVRAEVLRQGGLLIALGLGLGLAGSLAATRALSGLLFDIAAADALTWTMVTLLLALAALAACWVPARRASRVEPVIAMRDD